MNLLNVVRSALTLPGLFIIMLSSCKSKPENVFPDTVHVTKTDNLKRVKGTKLFVSVPAGYLPLEKLVRYQKNNNTYFQVIEMKGGNFTEQKIKMDREALEKQAGPLSVYEPVKFNGFDGIYMEGPSKVPDETKLGLIFGDDSFVTMVTGVCRSDDKAGREELKQIFSHAYYDKSYEFNPLELAGFKLDETITGFKYATSMGNMFVYTPDGRIDPKKAQEGSCYYIIPFEATSFEKVKELMEMTNSRMHNNDMQLSNMQQKETAINGYRAWEVSMNAIKDGEKVLLYEVGLFGNSTQSGLVFFCIDNDNGIYLERYKATAQSIRL